MSIRDTPPHKHASLSFSGRIARYADVKVRMMLPRKPTLWAGTLGIGCCGEKKMRISAIQNCEISKSRCL